MDSKDITLEIPYGTRDFLPKEARYKRVVEARIAEMFNSWGYDEIVTPTIEYLDTFTMGNDSSLEDGMFKLFDKTNRTLALRYEMTPPIARVVASRMKDEKFPLKLSYISSVFRYEKTQTGRQCEFHQAGVELIGSADVSADAEVIALAINVLKESGLNNFQVCLGQVDFINGIMQQCCLTSKCKSKIRKAIENRNLVELGQIVDETQLSDDAKAILKQLPLLHGGEEVLAKAYNMAMNEQSRLALDNLKEIYQLLKSYRVADYVTFDLGVIRNFSYYTGLVFEVYTPGLGFPVCGGGRYDNMLEDFGCNRPATGFALGIERVLLAMERQKLEVPHQQKDVYLAYAEGKSDEAVSRALALRDIGRTVDLANGAMTQEQANEYKELRGYDKLIYVE